MEGYGPNPMVNLANADGLNSYYEDFGVGDLDELIRELLDEEDLEADADPGFTPFSIGDGGSKVFDTLNTKF